MELKNVALIIRKDPVGGVHIFGRGLDVPIDLLDGENLFLGHVTIDAKHIFNEYKLDAGNSPDNLLLGGALDHKNYKHKIK